MWFMLCIFITKKFMQLILQFIHSLFNREANWSLWVVYIRSSVFYLRFIFFYSSSLTFISFFKIYLEFCLRPCRSWLLHSCTINIMESNSHIINIQINNILLSVVLNKLLLLLYDFRNSKVYTNTKTRQCSVS